VPTFCRHGRFVERCPICSKTLPGARKPSGGAPRRGSAGAQTASRGRRLPRGEEVRIKHQERAAEDGYGSPLLPGLRASPDAERLAQELAFSHGRLRALERAAGAAPLPELFAEVRALAAEGELEQASWVCFLSAYLCPLADPEPFVGIERALAVAREQLSELSEIPLGSRSSHEPSRGAATLDAYRAWYRQAGSQAQAFTGDESWTPERRFERVFERLALPGLTRAARYELLVLLGALGLYPLRADSLQLASARGARADDGTVLAAKRLFAIGDPLLLERRARALAEAIPVPMATLELALANWQADERAALGFGPETDDAGTLALARAALGL
jgi:Alpha-glutamyl/putrescinyl thymine pyrophosphorylase clade 3